MRIGDVEIEFLGHAGFILKIKNKIIAIDPYRISDKIPLADILLITHSHYDHCSIKDMHKISKKNTLAICPVDCQSTLMKVKNLDIHIVESGEVLDFGNFKIECVPAYTNSKHHPKNEGWLGYIVKFGNNIVYFAGDTDKIPEMNRLSGHGKKGNNFVAVLPVSGQVNMDASSAAQIASVLNASTVIPMSYGAGIYGTHEDAKRFAELCRQNGVNAQILEKI